VVQHAPSVSLPNPRAMVEQALARELAALRDRYDPLRRFFY
jgi:hypothetical protein